MTPKGYTDIPLDKKTIQLGLALGLMQWNETEQVYECTPKGKKWLEEYCDNEIAIWRCQAL